MKKFLVGGLALTGLCAGLYYLNKMIAKDIEKAYAYPKKDTFDFFAEIRSKCAFLRPIRLHTDADILDAQEYVKGIQENTNSALLENNQHWDRIGSHFLVGFILHSAYKHNSEEISLGQLRTWLEDSLIDSDDLLHEMMLLRHSSTPRWLNDGSKGLTSTHPFVRQIAQNILFRPNNERGSILAHAHRMVEHQQ